jgi:hypothetical protein
MKINRREIMVGMATIPLVAIRSSGYIGYSSYGYI